MANGLDQKSNQKRAYMPVLVLVSIYIFAAMWSYLLHETDQYNQIELTAVAVLCEQMEMCRENWIWHILL